MAVILTLQGKQWLAGLQWVTYPEEPSRDALLKEAVQEDAPWCVRRFNKSVYQAGFCKPVNDIARPRKIWSLAAMLADIRETPWLGTFELGDGLWWYIAVRDHYAIQPIGDIVGTDEEIQRARQEHDGWGHWTRASGTLETLDDLIQSSLKKGTKPTPIRSFAVSRIDPKPVIVGAAIAAAVGLAGAGAWHLHVKHERAKKKADYERAHPKKQGQEHVTNAQDLVVLQPMPSAWLASCEFAMKRALNADSMYGWVTTKVSCDEGTLNVVWKRGEGATIAHTPPGKIDSTGNIVTQVVDLPPAGRSIDNSAELSVETKSFGAWGQQYRIPIVTGDPAAISPKGGAGWRVPVTIPLSLSPFGADSGAVFDRIPGLRLTHLEPVQATAADPKVGQVDALDPEAHDVQVDTPSTDATSTMPDGADALRPVEPTGWKVTGVLYGRQ